MMAFQATVMTITFTYNQAESWDCVWFCVLGPFADQFSPSVDCSILNVHVCLAAGSFIHLRQMSDIKRPMCLYHLLESRVTIVLHILFHRDENRAIASQLREAERSMVRLTTKFL